MPPRDGWHVICRYSCMKKSIITQALIMGCVLGLAAIAPLQAQSSTSSTGTQTTDQKGGNDTLDNHAQGANNNQKATGGSNAERRSDTTSSQGGTSTH